MGGQVMYLGITSLSDDELQARRRDLDLLIQISSDELRLLHREHERRDWRRHAEIQSQVAAAEATAPAPPGAAAFVPTGSPAGEDVVTAVGEGVTVHT